MNYVIINGSYRKKGNTFSLVDSLIKGIKQSDSKAKLEIINLIDQKVEFCKGCTACFKVDGKDLGTCVQKDGFAKILSFFLKSAACSNVKKLPAGGFANKKAKEKFINKAFKLGLEFGQ